MSNDDNRNKRTPVVIDGQFERVSSASEFDNSSDYHEFTQAYDSSYASNAERIRTALDLLFHGDKHFPASFKDSLASAIDSGDDLETWIKEAGKPRNGAYDSSFSDLEKSELKKAKRFVRSEKFRDILSNGPYVAKAMDIWEDMDRKEPYDVNINRIAEKSDISNSSLSQEKLHNIRDYFTQLEKQRREALDATLHSKKNAKGGSLSDEEEYGVLHDYQSSKGSAPPSMEMPFVRQTKSRSIGSIAAKVTGATVSTAFALTGIPYVARPFIRTARDMGSIIKDIPKYYAPRIYSSKRSMEIVTGAIFPVIDNLKSTSAARLSIVINPENAIKKRNFVYKKGGASTPSHNLKGAVSNAFEACDQLQNDISDYVDAVKTSTHDAASKIDGLIAQLQPIVNIDNRAKELENISARYQNLSTNLLGQSDKSGLNSLETQLSSAAEKEQDPVCGQALSVAVQKLQDELKSSDGIDVIIGRVSDICTDIADIYSKRSMEASTQYQVATKSSSKLMKRLKDSIQFSQNTGNAVPAFEGAANHLSEQINIVEGFLSDIEGTIPSKEGDPLLGGSAVARLAAYDCRPHFEHVRSLGAKMDEMSQNLSFNIDHIIQDMDEIDFTAPAPFVLEQLRELSENLKDSRDSISATTGFKLNSLRSAANKAENAVAEMDSVVTENYTYVTKPRGHNYFSKTGSFNDGETGGSNTGYQVEFEVGRTERKATKADKKRLTSLVENGDLHINIPDNKTLKDVVEFRPGEDANNITPANTLLYKGNDYKFLEGVIVSQNPDMIPQAISRMTTMIENGNINGILECFKHGFLTYARNPDTFQSQGSRADVFYNKLFTEMRNESKGRLAEGRWEGAFDDYIEKKLRNAVEKIADSGANTTRDRLSKVYNWTRPIRYWQDHTNELEYGAADKIAAKAKGMTDAEYEQFLVKDMSADDAQQFKIQLQERRLARYFDSGLNKDQELGIKPFLRPLAVLRDFKPRQFMPYKMSYFSDFGQTMSTMTFKVAPRAAVVATWIAAAASLTSGNLSLDMGDIFDRDAKRPTVQYQIPERRSHQSAPSAQTAPVISTLPSFQSSSGSGSSSSSNHVSPTNNGQQIQPLEPLPSFETGSQQNSNESSSPPRSNQVPADSDQQIQPLEPLPSFESGSVDLKDRENDPVLFAFDNATHGVDVHSEDRPFDDTHFDPYSDFEADNDRNTPA